MSLLKKLKQAFLKEPKKEVITPIPAKKTTEKPVVPVQKPVEKKTQPVQKAPENKKPAAQNPPKKKNPNKLSPAKRKELVKNYNTMQNEYSLVKKFLMEKNTKEALPHLKAVVSHCLNINLARQGLSVSGTTDKEKMETIKNGKKTPDAIVTTYEKIMKRIGNEKEFIAQKEQSEATIRALGTIINYEKGEIFPKTGPRKSGQPKKKNAAQPNNAQPQAKKAQPQPKKEPEKKQNKLSFKAREKYCTNKPKPVDTREIQQKLDKAKEFIGKNNADDALTNVRRGLEIMATRLCEKFNVIQEGLTLENKIDELRSPIPLSQGQANVFHKARMLANRGSHYNDRAATLSEAQEALGHAKSVLEMYTDFMRRKSTEIFDNVPLRDPDYYSQNRKYYGRWYTCNTRQALSMNSDFMKLQAEAEKGDVQAMLDIAVGFLPTHIHWSEVSLVRHPDNARCCDPYDARYYYWITRACATAYKDWKSGKDLPLPYLATALLEGLKFYVYHYFHMYHPGNANGFVENQYEKVSQYMFGKFQGCAENFAEMLLAMMREYAPENLICTAHDERSEKYVKFLMYLTKIRWKDGLYYNSYARRNLRGIRDVSEPVEAKYAIRKEDTTVPANRAIENYNDFVYNIHRAYCNTILQRYKDAHGK